MSTTTNDTGRYEIQSVDARGDSLCIGWSDGHESHYPALALRANCTCEQCGSYETALRELRLTDIPVDVEIAEAACHGGHLKVVWTPDQHESLFSMRWLRTICNSQAERERRRWRPKFWGKEIEAAPPSMDYQDCVDNELARLELLELIRDFGFAVLRNAPTDPDTTEDIAALVGPLRSSPHGTVHDVRYDPDPEFYANTCSEILPHSDQAYRHLPPSITCFHFIDAAASGGESTLTDAFRAGADIRQENPAAYELLGTTPVTFHRRFFRRDKDYRIRAPIMSLDDMGEIAGVRLLDRAIGPLDAPEDIVLPYYAALRLLLEKLYEPDNQALVPIATGEVLFFNNHRVLHGRRAFDPRSGRHMRSCNIELDEFNSSLRFLAGKHGHEGGDMVLPHGALS
tara:strand:+ start:27 stop:1223 length:1197 start_codon:yes stop_codon:yes gene_type:complete